MRKAIFVLGAAIGFVFGARAGRDTYDKIVEYAKQVWEHPKVQQARSTAQARGTDLSKQAAAKAPDYAKGAMSSAKSTVSTQVPKFVQNVRQSAGSRMPSRFQRSSSTSATADPAADGAPSGQPDDVGPDGNLVYPADDGSATSATGRGRVTPDTP